MNLVLWIAQLLLAFAYGMAGVLKTTVPIPELSQQMPWTGDIPVGLVRFIGVAELAAAVGLVLPALTRIQPSLTWLAALGLVLVQALAIPFHLSRGETYPLPMNLAFLALAAFVAWGRMKKAPIAPRI